MASDGQRFTGLFVSNIITTGAWPFLIECPMCHQQRRLYYACTDTSTRRLEYLCRECGESLFIAEQLEKMTRNINV